jgi:hypothetical protein
MRRASRHSGHIQTPSTITQRACGLFSGTNCIMQASALSVFREQVLAGAHASHPAGTSHHQHLSEGAERGFDAWKMQHTT